MNEVKVLVIILDGAPFDVFHSLAEEGILPNFGKLIKDGCFNILHSTFPPVSPIAIPSLVTGKNPGKHGMFGYGRFENGVFIPYTSESMRGAALWDILAAAGKKVVLLNVPWTFPPFKVNGVMVSGFPSPRNIVKSYPPGLVNLLRSEIGHYYVDLRYAKEGFRGLLEKRFLEEVYLVTKKREEAMHYLMENYEWDLFLATFTSLDRMQHGFFGYFDKESSFFNERKREVLVKYYKEIDSILGRTISLIEENTILMIASDHGFEPLYKYVGVNNLLVQGGFAKARSRYNFFTLERIKSFLEKIGLSYDIQRKIPSKIIIRAMKTFPSRINYTVSKAYATNGVMISLNRDALQNGETYQSIRRRLIDFLHSIVDEENGEKIIEEVYDSDEIYSGNLDDAQDLVIAFKKGYEPKLWVEGIMKSVKRMKNKTVKTGTHAGFTAQRGILIVLGKGIKKGFLSEAKIADVCPTILHILGVPVPADMDGRVAKEVFEPRSRFAKRSIKCQPALMKKKEEISKLSREEEEEIKNRLRSLGYI